MTPSQKRDELSQAILSLTRAIGAQDQLLVNLASTNVNNLILQFIPDETPDTPPQTKGRRKRPKP